MSDLSVSGGDFPVPDLLSDKSEPDVAVSNIPWQATKDLVIVRRVKRQKSKQGRLYIPDAHNEEQNVALVEQTGPEVVDPGIVKGAVVLIGEWGGTQVTVDGLAYFILAEEEILAIYKETS